MRIAVITAPAKPGKGLDPFTLAVEKAMSSMGHRVDTYKVPGDDYARLSTYDYIVVLTEPVSTFSSKLPVRLGEALGSVSSLIGKKSAAFIRAQRFFSAKAMNRLMALLEKEGMYVNWSEMFSKPAEAERLAKKIGS